MDYETKREIAQYLIGVWDLSEDEYSKDNIEFEVALDKARVAYANDRPIRWKMTPSASADMALTDFFEEN